MKITEINAGNYVYNKDNELCKVCVVNMITNSVIVDNYAHDDGTFYEYAIEEIKGVPITNEILEKNGFHKDTDNVLRQWIEDVRFAIEINALGVYVSVRHKCNVTSALHVVISYVHELQHIFRLLYIDKEIYWKG